jgi:CRISPR system Cascade subunit CasB
VTRLEELHKHNDRAALAQLKRAAGRPLADCPGLFPLFYRLLPPQAQDRKNVEEVCFLVATLFPLSPSASHMPAGDLGKSLRGLADERRKAHPSLDDTPVDRRMEVLLDSSRDALPFRLRQLIGLLAAHEVPVDWRSLLSDILAWDHPQRLVQKHWARSYFGGRGTGAGVGAAQTETNA